MRNFLTVALALGLALPAAGCFDELTGPYDGPTLVEFAQGPPDQVLGVYGRRVADVSATITLTVNLIGPQQSSPVTVGVTTEGSTAVEGTNFSFPNGSDVTIPANSSFGELTINVLDANITPGQSVDLNLELTQSADGSIQGADNLDDFTIRIIGT